MSDTPTPAPTLTDEQIEVVLRNFRKLSYGEQVLAAVIARAKREAAEEIAHLIDRLHDTVYQARRVPELDPLRVDTACQAYRVSAAIARQIGADHD